MNTPQDYGIPHSEWREHQHETLQQILSSKSFVICEAPTGSGKSAFACGVSSVKSVVVLTQTKLLQDAYGEIYGAEVLKGRGNYDCVNPEAEPGAKCDACLHSEEGMKRCKYYGNCEYIIAKEIAASSPFSSLNYPYWTASHWGEKHPPGALVCDEAHDLPEIVVNWAGCTVTEKQRVDWDLPQFPDIAQSDALKSKSLFNPAPKVDAIGLARSWLLRSVQKLRVHYRLLQRSALAGSVADRKRLRKCDNLARKLSNALDAMEQSTQSWYVCSGASALQFGRRVRPGFVAKPLTAKHHFSHLFTGAYHSVAMSATIGDFSQFAAEIGVDSYQSITVPSRFGPERRPVHVLDAPKMGHIAKETDLECRHRFDKQADVIADYIKQWPSHWSGLIHVTRISEEIELARRLADRGLADRIWNIPGRLESYVPTDTQLDAWNERLEQVPNSLLVTCSFSQGYNGLREKLNLSVKVPFPVWGSEGSYENRWARYSRDRYNQVAARRIAQQLGRTRRGREEDYDTATEVRGACAIVDASLSRVEKYLPEALRSALVKV